MNDPKWFTYHFEAVSIQEYIFAGAKLKDMVAASELVDQLCDAPLTKLIATLDLSEISFDSPLDLNSPQTLPSLSLPNQDEIVFPRKAGGAFIAVMASESVAHRFAALWSLVVSQFAPGLKFSASLGQGVKLVDAIKQGIDKQKAQRNVVYPSLPQATPIMERSPRTGEWVAERSARNPDAALESLDLATQIKRQRTDSKAIGLDNKFLAGTKDYRFPVCIEHNDPKACGKQEAFPFQNQGGAIEGAHHVGLIHADGNGLGQFLHDFFAALSDKSDAQYLQAYAIFTQGLETATIKAGQIATQRVLMPLTDHGVLPMRPIVLGGDDLTVICRADCAFDYTQSFIEAFEQQTQLLMKQINKLVKLDKNFERLTACAGIAFVKSNQPFYMASHLAESLCSYAKEQSREAKTTDEIPSSLAFHYITTSLFEDAKTGLNQELTAHHQEAAYQLTLGAYQINNDTQTALTSWQDFKMLADMFNNHPEEEDSTTLTVASLRNLATWIHADLERAKEVYKRWAQVANSTKRGEKDWQAFMNALKTIGISNHVSGLPFKLVSISCHASPVSDLIAYRSLTNV